MRNFAGVFSPFLLHFISSFRTGEAMSGIQQQGLDGHDSLPPLEGSGPHQHITVGDQMIGSRLELSKVHSR